MHKSDICQLCCDVIEDYEGRINGMHNRCNDILSTMCWDYCGYNCPTKDSYPTISLQKKCYENLSKKERERIINRSNYK